MANGIIRKRRNTLFNTDSHRFITFRAYVIYFKGIRGGHRYTTISIFILLIGIILWSFGTAVVLKKLGKTGRVVLRPSGTEKKIRIMAECEEENLLNKTIKNLKSRISTLINEYEKN